MKDIPFFKENQSEEMLPWKEKLKIVRDNQQQRRMNKTYADVAVNITDKSDQYGLCIIKQKAIMN